ncbi:unnamed protein product [Lota lota]
MVALPSYYTGTAVSRDSPARRCFHGRTRRRSCQALKRDEAHAATTGRVYDVVYRKNSQSGLLEEEGTGLLQRPLPVGWDSRGPLIQEGRAVVGGSEGRLGWRAWQTWIKLTPCCAARQVEEEVEWALEACQLHSGYHFFSYHCPCQRLFQTPPWPPQPWLWPRLRLRLETQGLATALQTDANNPTFTPV